MRPVKTLTVQSSYLGRDKQPRVYIKGHPQPYLTDEPLNEGDAVVIEAGRARRARG